MISIRHTVKKGAEGAKFVNKVTIHNGLLRMELAPEIAGALIEHIKERIRSITHRVYGSFTKDCMELFVQISILSRFGYSLSKSKSLDGISFEDAEFMLQSNVLWHSQFSQVESDVAEAKKYLRRAGCHDPVWQDQVAKDFVEVMES